jgi:hypothetical protein
LGQLQNFENKAIAGRRENQIVSIQGILKKFGVNLGRQPFDKYIGVCSQSCPGNGAQLYLINTQMTICSLYHQSSVALTLSK